MTSGSGSFGLGCFRTDSFMVGKEEIFFFFNKPVNIIRVKIIEVRGRNLEIAMGS